MAMATSLAPGASLAATSEPTLRSRDLAPGLTLVQGAGANILRLEHDRSVLLVDSGAAAHADAVLRQAQAGGCRVRTVINTHCHADHIGGNALLARAGARIIAHENTRLWMQRPVSIPWENRTVGPAPRQAWPTQTFYTTERLDFGAQELRYGWLGQAHTDGDLYVHLPRSNVLVVGGVVSQGRWPMPDWTVGGWIGGLVDAGRQLLALCDDQTVIVAGQGEPVGRAHLQAQTDMLDLLKERIWQLMRKGLSDLDIVEARPTAEFDAQWGDPRLFLLNTYKGLWGHVRELRGIV